jgi:F420-dependent oxidoreductase-like protein
MKLRIFTEPQQGASYDQLLVVAREAEALGFDAFFRSDHYLKMGTASGLPAYTDAWTTLAGLARDTETIRLGTLVTPTTFRRPGPLAVTVAQVDHMSHGRLEVGLGAGWFEEEHRNYGIPFPPVGERFDLLEDQLAVLHGVWKAEPGTVFRHEGRTLSVELEVSPLRPAQAPHPPVIMGGGGGPRNSRLAATYADEFNAPFMGRDEVSKVFGSVRRACEAQGRDPRSLRWSTAQVVCCGRDEAEVARRARAIDREPDELRQNGLTGSPAEVADKLHAYAEAGAGTCYLQILDLADLDHLRLLAEQVLPVV